MTRACWLVGLLPAVLWGGWVLLLAFSRLLLPTLASLRFAPGGMRVHCRMCAVQTNAENTSSVKEVVGPEHLHTL